jgi:uncharacterized Ntn-hydrolase superfamily protein
MTMPHPSPLVQGAVTPSPRRSISVRRIARSVVIALSFAAAARSASAQEPASWGETLRFSTFSIAAIDPETGEVGVAVSTRVPCVGNVVPHVRVGVGALATQAMTRIEYGGEVLDLIEGGLDPQTALDRALATDNMRAHRQIGVIALDGRTAQHTGREAMPWAGHRSGRNYVTQGNLLVGRDVLEAVARNFESSAGTSRRLADRLIEAIAAGEGEGGDARKGISQSAAVVVADPRPNRAHRADRVTTNINVCEHDTPVDELRRIYDSVSETLGYRTLQQFSGADVYQLKIMLHALGYYRPGEPDIRPDIASHFFTTDVVQAVNSFREAEGLSGPDLGTPPGLVDDETVHRLWQALERKGIADDVHRRLRDITRH